MFISACSAKTPISDFPVPKDTSGNFPRGACPVHYTLLTERFVLIRQSEPPPVKPEVLQSF